MRAEQQAPVAPAFLLLIALAASPLVIRGREQPLHLYGEPGRPAVVLLSGDGGWIHVAPRVAEHLASSGYFVVGIDARAYLESFTRASGALRVEDVRQDIAAMVALASSRGAPGARPVLAGVSEGAGLALIGAGSSAVRPAVGGVLAIGLPSQIELGWRWRDAIIYFTHATPNEPLVPTSGVIGAASPVPVAVIHSLHDEYTPLTEAESLIARAGEPKKLWTISAADHRFSDKLDELDARVGDAMAWLGRGGR
jgi:alpha-beta hydrolase superfamily lysophospholipase